MYIYIYIYIVKWWQKLESRDKNSLSLNQI